VNVNVGVNEIGGWTRGRLGEGTLHGLKAFEHDFLFFLATSVKVSPFFERLRIGPREVTDSPAPKKDSRGAGASGKLKAWLPARRQVFLISM
jgi:hypothetical protein